METLRAILLLLYGTGLRVGEAVALNGRDVDLQNALFTIRDTKFFKCRLVPFSRDLTGVLPICSRRVSTRPFVGDEARLFTARGARAIHQSTLEDAFQRLRQHAASGVTIEARYQPRMHDLRHTFAVHRLTSGIGKGRTCSDCCPCCPSTSDTPTSRPRRST